MSYLLNIIFRKKLFFYEFNFPTKGMNVVITNNDNLVEKKEKDGYLVYVDPTNEHFDCFKKLNKYFFIMIKCD